MNKYALALLPIIFAVDVASATPYLPLDPRSISMGGASVAVANSSQAHYYNPALLVNAPADEDFNVEIDSSLRGADPDSLIDNMATFAEERYLTHFIEDFNSLTTSIATAINNGSTIEIEEVTDVISKRNKLVTSSNNLLDGIHSITNRSGLLDINAGLFISNPEPTYGWTLFYNTYLPIAAQGNLHPDDDQLMTDLIDILDVELNQDDLVQTVQKLQTLSTQLSNPAQELNSSVSIYGAVIQEIGFAYAMKSSMDGYAFDFGVTPKLLSIETFDETRSLNRIELQDNVEKSGQTKEYSAFNLDFGISKSLSEHWRTGLAFKNLIGQSYKTPNGHHVKIDPSSRIGISYTNNWINFGADLDITENKAAAGIGKTQFVAIGAEVDVWLLQLRTGYRVDLANDISFPSVGLGLYLFGLNVDAALAGTLPKAEENSKPIDVFAGIDDLTFGLRVGIKW